MADNGGKRPRSGRPTGAKNRIKTEREKELVASGVTPLEFFLDRMRDPDSSEDTKRWGAEKAAPYIHARLRSTEMKIEGRIQIEIVQ